MDSIVLIDEDNNVILSYPMTSKPDSAIVKNGYRLFECIDEPDFAADGERIRYYPDDNN